MENRKLQKESALDIVHLKEGRGSLAPTLLTHLYLQVFVSLVPTKSKILAQLYLQGWGGVGWG